ncbi:MAG: hypothetical protein PHE53_04080 [Thermoguttaceae bacterium]|nr:hypothetical protein [Thermoguttaceae bacterium]
MSADSVPVVLPKQFLFPVAFPCYRRASRWQEQSVSWESRYRLANLAMLEPSKPHFVQWYAAWNPDGVLISVQITGKSQYPWCRPNRIDESDRLTVLLDTRNVHSVHRANRYCHRFLFMPGGSGVRLDRPFTAWQPIHRAKDHPDPVSEDGLHAAVRFGDPKRNPPENPNDYQLDCWIPRTALTGFDPVEHTALGFNAIVYDRELGVESLGPAAPLPMDDDPSLWTTLELCE